MAAIVTYKKGVTVNTGNFESERFEFMVTRECEDNVETIKEMTADLKTYVDGQVAMCVDELKGGRVDASTSKKSTNKNMEDLLV